MGAMQVSRHWTGEALAYLAIAGLIVLLLYPALAWLVESWVSNPYYTHGFLVPLVAALLAWRQWPRLAAEPRRGATWPGVSLTLASLTAIIWGMRWQNYVVVSLALVALLAGILLYLEGWPRLRHWLFPLLFLALMVPLPFMDIVSPWFESATARWATALARLVGISATQQGGEITLPNTVIVVGAPCSGLRSLVAMVTLSVAWVYLVEGRLAAKALMLAAAVPLVLLSNVLRIALLLVISISFGQEVALTYYHDWSGLVLFLMALGLLLILGKVLGCSKVRDDIF
jgi:exosortase